jgi:hypothetical protein
MLITRHNEPIYAMESYDEIAEAVRRTHEMIPYGKPIIEVDPDKPPGQSLPSPKPETAGSK